MSSSTAMATIPKDGGKQAEAEKVPAKASVIVPAALLLAAEAVCQKPGASASSYLEGVFLHRKGDRGRVVGTDGSRMFISSFKPENGELPDWMKTGLILSNLQLRSRLALLGKLTGSRLVRVTYAEGDANVELSDLEGATTFKIKSLDGSYPAYEAALSEKSFSQLNEDGEQETREWTPVGINSVYLKQCGEIAKTLEAGLPADQRSKLGMVIRAFNGGAADSPLVFDFSTWPGALLVVAPAVMATKAIAKETAAILQPAVKATIAALRAHQTRNEQSAAAATSDVERERFTARSNAFKARIAAIHAMTRDSAAIGGKSKTEAVQQAKAEPEAQTEPKGEDEPKKEPEAKAEVEAKPTGDEDQADETEEAAGFKKPKVTRTKINVKRRASGGANAAAAH